MSKYIGHASAYAYAKTKGYTGTEEEFAELMASYARVAQDAADVMTEAQEAIADVRSAIDDTVIVSETEPQSEDNKLWIKDGATEEYQIPTYEEFSALETAMSDKADKTDTVLETTLSRGRKEDTTIGVGSFAFGNNVEASGLCSYAEGKSTTASGNYSHAEGNGTAASGMHSHAEGGGAVASGLDSHAQGWRTIANHRSQTVIGECNVEDPSTADSENRGTYVEIVGNGTAANARSNARTLDWDGNEVLAGTITANGVNLNDEISGLTSVINDAPTEESGQELAEAEQVSAELMDVAFTVIGKLFDSLPQDEAAAEIADAIALECERLQIIYDGWMTEKGA